MGQIYCLYSTENGQPRYVGQTEGDSDKRLKKHRTLALEMAQGRLYDWIRDLYRRGFEVEAHILQTDVIPAELEFYERYWLAQFSDLLNVRDAVPPPEPTDIARQVVLAITARLAIDEGQTGI